MLIAERLDVQIQQARILIITVTIVNFIITISRHIKNPGIVRTVYSGIFRPLQGHSAIFHHVQAYWETLRHIEAYFGIIDACEP